MKSDELYKLVINGKHPIIKFTKEIVYFADESFDPEMIGKVIGATKEYEDSYRFLIDLNDYEKHNRSVACPNWRDSNGEPKLTWFETSAYPKDGKEAFYLPLNSDVPLEIIEDTSLFNEFLSSGSNKGYIVWLEEQLNTLRNRNK